MAALPEKSVDLIYADPPFPSGRDWYYQGEVAFTDRGMTDQAYRALLDEWLRGARRVLKPTGNLFWHCDHRTAHWAREAGDRIFGPQSFVNEIVWRRFVSVSNSSEETPERRPRHDPLLPPNRLSPILRWSICPSALRQPRNILAILTIRGIITSSHWSTGGSVTIRIAPMSLWASRGRGTGRAENMAKLVAEGRVVQTSPGAVPRRKIYLSESQGCPLDTIWADVPNVNSQAHELTGWPTQKPLALLERIITLACPEGGLVLDSVLVGRGRRWSPPRGCGGGTSGWISAGSRSIWRSGGWRLSRRRCYNHRVMADLR